jgi:hypothetical protein
MKLSIFSKILLKNEKMIGFTYSSLKTFENQRVTFNNSTSSAGFPVQRKAQMHHFM